jgi:hypothetical protein
MLYDAVQFLKGSVGRSLPGGSPSLYIFHNGACFAQSAVSLASYPTPELPSTFALAAEGLEQSLGRMKQQPELSAGDNEGTLVLKKGRLRTTLQIMYADPIDAMPDAALWAPVPAGLVAALRKALPFVSPQGTWQKGIKLGEGHIVAVSNRAAIQIEVPDLDLGRTEIITDDCVKYIVGLDDEPTTMFHDPGALWFGWDSGAWLKCQLLAYEWGNVADRALDMAGDDAPIVIDDDWRGAVADVIALGGNSLSVGPEGLSSKADYSVVEAQMDIAVERVTEWAADILEEVVKVADRWNPSSFQAARFYGTGLRGVVVGIRR